MMGRQGYHSLFQCIVKLLTKSSATWENRAKSGGVKRPFWFQNLLSDRDPSVRIGFEGFRRGQGRYTPGHGRVSPAISKERSISLAAFTKSNASVLGLPCISS